MFKYTKKELDLIINKYFLALGIDHIYLEQAINGYASDLRSENQDPKFIKKIAISYFKYKNEEIAKFNLIGNIKSILSEFEQSPLINKKLKPINQRDLSCIYLTNYSLSILTDDLSYPAIIIKIDYQDKDNIVVSLTVSNHFIKYINPLHLIASNFDDLKKLLTVYSEMSEIDLNNCLKKVQE